MPTVDTSIFIVICLANIKLILVKSKSGIYRVSSPAIYAQISQKDNTVKIKYVD